MCSIFVVLTLVTCWNHLGSFQKCLCLGPPLAKIDLIGLGCGLGLSSLDDFPLQLRLKVSVLETQTEST